MTFGEPSLDPDELRTVPLGERIYRIRKSLDISQAEVAGAVGVNVKTVNRWENDEADPRRQSRAALAEATGYPESLFKRKTPAPAAGESSVLDEIRGVLEGFENDISLQLKNQSHLLEQLGGVAVRLVAAVSMLEDGAARLGRASEELAKQAQTRRPA